MFRSFQSKQLEENIHTSDTLQLKSFPCHKQAVEMGRPMKLVTEECAAVCEPQRDGFIGLLSKSREKNRDHQNRAWLKTTQI